MNMAKAIKEFPNPYRDRGTPVWENYDTGEIWSLECEKDVPFTNVDSARTSASNYAKKHGKKARFQIIDADAGTFAVQFVEAPAAASKGRKKKAAA
jgi:hypothetical protein